MFRMRAHTDLALCTVQSPPTCVTDLDPYVFGPVLWLLCDFLSLKNDVNVP
jgi:hypothetical protein